MPWFGLDLGKAKPPPIATIEEIADPRAAGRRASSEGHADRPAGCRSFPVTARLAIFVSVEGELVEGRSAPLEDDALVRQMRRWRS
jgi:hypothetical protein